MGAGKHLEEVMAGHFHIAHNKARRIGLELLAAPPVNNMSKTTIWPLNQIQGIEGIDFVVDGFVATKNAATNFPNGLNLLVAGLRKTLKLLVIHVGESRHEVSWENVFLIPADLMSVCESFVTTDWKGVGNACGLLNGLDFRSQRAEAIKLRDKVIESSGEGRIVPLKIGEKVIESLSEVGVFVLETAIRHPDVVNFDHESPEVISGSS